MDVKSANLNDKLEETTYRRQSQGYIKPTNHHLAPTANQRTVRAQAGKTHWHQTIDPALNSSHLSH
jgi:hypothetical protein